VKSQKATQNRTVNFRTRNVEREEKLHKAISMDVIERIVPKATMEGVIAETGVKEVRERKLSAWLVILVTIAMNIYSQLPIEGVLAKVLKGVRLLRLGDGENERCATAGAISQRRYQLGWQVMQTLFKRVCKPLATAETKGGFLYGLRLMAMDGTKEDVPDTKRNVRKFGRHKGPKGASGYPKLQAVLLAECGTHAIVDAEQGRCYASERGMGTKLLRSITAGMLLMFDRGFYSFDLISQAVARGAQVLGRMSSHIKPKLIQRLKDGSHLAYIYPSQTKRRKNGEHLLIRVIEYTFTDPARPGYNKRHRLFTTLIDPDRYPALALVCAYHERWEVELVIDELQTHQRLVNHPFRSLKPDRVIQEFYALLIAHYVIRAFIHEAALQSDLDPDRISFVGALRILQDALTEFQIANPIHHPLLFRRLLLDIAAQTLPSRRNRINPRVVKRTVMRFKRKRRSHRSMPQPSCSFSNAVELI
jgi:hypothetical protein